LKIETQNTDDNQSRLTVEVEPELLDEMKQRAARKIARSIKIPGFRPGKAPYPVIVRQVGEEAVLEEAMELLVDEIYPKVIDQAEIKPYGPGKLEKVVSTEPLVLEFLVPLEAQVSLGDYRSIRKAYEPKQVTEKDVDEVMENLRERQAIIEPVERPALSGDQVTVHISGNRKHVEEGQNPVLVRDREVPVIILPAEEKEEKEGNDAPDYPEWPFPGFSQKLIGLSANDERTFEYQYPDEDAQPQAFKGADAEFLVKVENVKSRTLPALDDDFATSLGEFETLEALRTNVRTSLEEQNTQEYNETYDTEIIEQAIEQANFKYPPQLREHELDDVVRDLESRLERQKLDMDLYLKTRKLDMKDLREEMIPVAEKRLKHSLFLSELAKAEDIHIDPDELQSETQNTVEVLSRSLPEKEARKLSNKDIFSNLVGNIMLDMIFHKAEERFRDIASGKLDQQAAEAAAKEETPTAEAEPALMAEASAVEGGVADPAMEAAPAKPKKRKKAQTPPASS